MKFVRRGLGIVMAVATVECVTRQVQFAPRVLDQQIGFVVPAGSRTRWAVEGNGTGHYDANGVRRGGDGGVGPTVLVVGDSFTEALHVDDDATFVARAASDVREAGFPCRLLNVGIAGQRTPMYVEHAPVYFARYSPAWTVVVLNAEDLTADMFVTNGTYFSLDGDRLALHAVPVSGGNGVSGRWRQAKTNSALLQRAALQGAGFLGEVRATRLFRSAAPRPAAMPPNAADYPVAQALDALYAAYDQRLTLVYLSSFERSPSVDAVENVVMDHCRSRRRSCVALREEFPSFWETGGAPYGHPNNGFNVGHLNAVGHAAVGRVLARELRRIHDDGLF